MDETKKEDEYQPPTPEQWERLPEDIRIYLFLKIFYHVSRKRLSDWFILLGLRLGGLRV